MALKMAKISTSSEILGELPGENKATSESPPNQERESVEFNKFLSGHLPIET
jgi:hypothetical protein